MKTKTEKENLKELTELKGKVRFLHGEIEFLREYKGEITKDYGETGTQALIKMDSKYYYGEAKCCDRDQFSKRIGRAIALGRAMVECRNDNTTKIDKIPEELKFREDVPKVEA